MPCRSYTGRFAPSPTGALHTGSFVAALASWLDARAHCGIWLVRMEDVDTPRCVPGAGEIILSQLAVCGLVSDAPVLWQSSRQEVYRHTLDDLRALDMAYPCACSRSDIVAAQARLGLVPQRHRTLPYPGTCRHGLNGRPACAWRFRTDVLRSGTPTGAIHWCDRRLGWQSQDVGAEVGDFVLRRADGLWAYQLAVVVDDAHQGITDVVRGEDLADNTARQILLQRALNLPAPRYLHTPLVLGANGEKLSKQNGAVPVDTHHPLRVLGDAAQALGLPCAPEGACVAGALAFWVNAWRALFAVGKCP